MHPDRLENMMKPASDKVRNKYGYDLYRVPEAGLGCDLEVIRSVIIKELCHADDDRDELDAVQSHRGGQDR